MRIFLNLPDELEELLEFFVSALTGHRLSKGYAPWTVGGHLDSYPDFGVRRDPDFGSVMESFGHIARQLYLVALETRGRDWADGHVDRINRSILENRKGIARIASEVTSRLETLLPDRMQDEVDQLLGG
jgi:hypothetical protein